MGGTRRALFVPQRRRAAIDYLREAGGRASVRALAESLQVTTETVRQDLQVLQRHGLLRRVHGGAELVQRGDSDEDRAARDNCTDQVRAVLAELEFASVMLLDASPFGCQLAAALYPNHPLTVITNSLPAAQILTERAHITLITLTGRVDAAASAVVGERALDQIGDVTADCPVPGLVEAL